MKRIAFYLPLVMATSMFAKPTYITTATDTITGSTDSESPALFTDATAWGGTVPELSKTSVVKLTGEGDGTLYYDINGSPTLNAIYTDDTITSNYVISNSASGGKTTFDIKSYDKYDKTIIQYSLGSYDGSMRISGNYDIISTGSKTGTEAMAAITMASSKISSLSKGIYFEKGSLINSYVKLNFYGNASSNIVYGNGINVAGTINAYNGTEDQWGALQLAWDSNPYDSTGGGVRTKLNVQDGGVINTGVLTVGTRGWLNVESGGTVNVYDTLEITRNSSNPSYIDIAENANVTVANDIIFIGSTPSAGGSFTMNVKGTLNVGGDITHVTYSSGKEACLNLNNTVVSGTLNLGGSINLGATGSSLTLNTGATFTGAIDQNGGSLVFNSGATWNATGTSTLTTNTALKGNVNIASGAVIDYTTTNGQISSLSNVVIDGELRVSSALTSDTYQLVVNGGNTIVNSGGKIDITGTYTSSYSFGIFLKDGILDVYGTVNTEKLLLGNGTLIVREGANMTSPTSSLIVVAPAGDYNSRIELYQDIAFNDFYIQKGATVTIALKDADVIFKSTQIRGQTNEISYIVFEDFQNERIFSENKNSLNYLNLSGTALDGTKLVDENFYWEATTGGYWLNYNFPAVPEPAEWAMILGSIALGLAIYRRRK